MTHDVDAIYHQGVFQPVEPLALPEGIRVHLRIESSIEAMTRSGIRAKILSPRLAHPEQVADFEMEVGDVNAPL